VRFASDNRPGVAPEVLDAITDEAARFGDAYDEGELPRRLDAALSELFEHETYAFPVLTGTAANSISLAALCDPWGAVLCSPFAHVLIDECGAPEFFGGGLRLVPLPGPLTTLDLAEIQAIIDGSATYDVHHMALQALTVTNLDELGGAIRPDRMAALGEVAKERGLALHLDGARFANAVAATGASPAELTWRAGVEIMSFGGTKNGALMAEAVVVFDRARAERIARLRKRSGHLFSKMRFVTVQLLAQLRDGRWLDRAAHANAMARRLADGLGVRPPDGNELFVTISSATSATWSAEGVEFYDTPLTGTETRIARLVTTWATTPEDVDEFVRIAHEQTPGGWEKS
jgi:threonine aldolase